MATLIGDVYGAESSPFHSRAQTPGIATPHHHQQQQQQKQHHIPQQHTSQQHHHNQQQHPPSPQSQQDRDSHIEKAAAAASKSKKTEPITTTSHHPASPPLSSSNSFSSPPAQATASAVAGGVAGLSSNSTSSQNSKVSARIPTPPDSSSPSSPHQTRDGCEADMTSSSETTIMAVPANNSSSTSNSTSSSAATTAVPPATTSFSSCSSLPGYPAYVLPGAAPPREVPEERSKRTLMIRDLHHIKSLSETDGAGSGGSLGNGLAGGSFSSSNGTLTQDVKYDISSMPIGDIIEMVAALLTKITTTNDHQHDALNRNASQQRQAQAHNEGGENSSGGSPFSASVLAFHGKNVPAITILSYLSRIHKYCPTTYEVFLSLLVYFDRMTERVNELVMRQQQERERERERRAVAAAQQTAAGGPSNTAAITGSTSAAASTAASSTGADVDMYDAGEDGAEADETDEGLADSDSGSSSSDDDDEEMTGGGILRRVETVATTAAGGGGVPGTSGMDALAQATYFVVDSYNIHRLIIAGVTCASKFFSDVFYTNARYAKVGGLPLAELNHLELQFLILNDFRLAIPIEDLEAYATMLVEFYMREVIGTHQPQAATSVADTIAS
ncbi:cyclin-like protein interacting with PHO85 [Sporothrix bragantina]|uniref:Cyclin-like protein interacting with PHO85 n=1 Tax=Sporothrix bragantina TaxID=671064 RepID=A0ABP0ATP8_9PEZI